MGRRKIYKYKYYSYTEIDLRLCNFAKFPFWNNFFNITKDGNHWSWALLSKVFRKTWPWREKARRRQWAFDNRVNISTGKVSVLVWYNQTLLWYKNVCLKRNDRGSSFLVLSSFYIFFFLLKKLTRLSTVDYFKFWPERTNCKLVDTEVVIEVENRWFCVNQSVCRKVNTFFICFYFYLS